MDLKDWIDLGKWIIVGIAAVISFRVTDVGRLELDKQRFQVEHRQKLLDSYLQSSDTTQPLVWRRKLQALSELGDECLREFARSELDYINRYSEKAALYREAVKVASILSNRPKYAQPPWNDAKERFDQLYFADLPLAHESTRVAREMRCFRSCLIQVEERHTEKGRWDTLSIELLRLANVIRESMPRDNPSAKREPSSGKCGDAIQAAATSETPENPSLRTDVRLDSTDTVPGESDDRGFDGHSNEKERVQTGNSTSRSSTWSCSCERARSTPTKE